MSLLRKATMLWRLSRPHFHMYTLGPWLVGTAAVDFFEAVQNPVWWLFTFFWWLPANIFLYGVNDLADEATDALNTKKDDYEQRLKKQDRHFLRLSIWIILSFAAALLWLLPVSAQMALLGFIILGAGYSLPPTRFKAIPFLDSYSNLLYILPGVVSFSWLTGNWPPLWVFLAGWFWCVAMHTYSAIPDISADKKAGVTTTAVYLGTTKAILYVGWHWLVTATLVVSAIGFATAGSLLLIYPAVTVGILFTKFLKNEKVKKLIWNIYRLFPYINAAVGFCLFWWLVLT